MCRRRSGIIRTLRGGQHIHAGAALARSDHPLARLMSGRNLRRASTKYYRPAMRRVSATSIRVRLLPVVLHELEQDRCVSRVQAEERNHEMPDDRGARAAARPVDRITVIKKSRAASATSRICASTTCAQPLRAEAAGWQPPSMPLEIGQVYRWTPSTMTDRRWADFSTLMRMSAWHQLRWPRNR